MSAPLSPNEIQAALAGLPGWRFEDDALAKTYQLETFREAMAFLVRVGFEAEELNHHPDWSNAYRKVSIRLRTHDAGGKVTARDVELARRIQRIGGAA
jgi:4a-hydroxytetrahydrobiopterin dehydratase